MPPRPAFVTYYVTNFRLLRRARPFLLCHVLRDEESDAPSGPGRLAELADARDVRVALRRHAARLPAGARRRLHLGRPAGPRDAARVAVARRPAPDLVRGRRH